MCEYVRGYVYIYIYMYVFFPPIRGLDGVRAVGCRAACLLSDVNVCMNMYVHIYIYLYIPLIRAGGNECMDMSMYICIYTFLSFGGWIVRSGLPRSLFAIRCEYVNEYVSFALSFLQTLGCLQNIGQVEYYVKRQGIGSTHSLFVTRTHK